MKISDEQLDKLIRSEENHSFNKTFSYRERKERSSAAHAHVIKVKRLAVCAALLVFFITAFAFAALQINHGGTVDHVTDATDSVISVTSKADAAQSSETQKNSIHEKPREEESTLFPSWYAPGKLYVRSVTLKPEGSPELTSAVCLSRGAEPAFASGAESCCSNSVFSLSGQPTNLIGSRYIDVTGILSKSEHRTHGFLVYDAEKERELCFSCMAREALGTRVLSRNEQIMIDPVSEYDVFSFAIYDNLKECVVERRLCETETGVLRSVPVLSENDIDLFKLSPGAKYILTHAVRKSDSEYDDVYLINADTMEYAEISRGEPTFMLSEFSPDCKNALVAMRDKHGSAHGFESYSCVFLLVNTSTLESCRCEGKVLSFADGLLVTCDGGKYHVYDREKCEEVTPDSDIYAFDIRGGYLIRVNAKDGSESVLQEKPDGYSASPDGCYFYTYVSSEEHIRCYCKDNGEMFKVRLHSDFTDFINELKDNNTIFYSISLNNEMDELLICCSYTPKQSF